MFKRSNANYSLWPEQARPRRGMSLSLAAGGFAVGIICAVAAVNVASDFIRPVAMEPEVVRNTDPLRPIPVYSASTATAEQSGEPAEGETTRSRTRQSARVALPAIGRAVPVVAETDGRGGDSAVKPTAGPPNAKGDADAKLGGSEAKPLRENTPTSRGETQVAARESGPQAAEARTQEAAAAPSEEAKPAAAKRRSVHRRSAKPRRTKEVRKHERRRSPSYAAPYRAGPTYGYNGAPVFGYYHY